MCHRKKSVGSPSPITRAVNRTRSRLIGKWCGSVDQEQLPADAVFKDYVDVVVQDLSIHTDNVQFHKEKYYSPGQKRTYLACLPAGYHGQFGLKVRAWVLA